MSSKEYATRHLYKQFIRHLESVWDDASYSWYGKGPLEIDPQKETKFHDHLAKDMTPKQDEEATASISPASLRAVFREKKINKKSYSKTLNAISVFIGYEDWNDFSNNYYIDSGNPEAAKEALLSDSNAEAKHISTSTKEEQVNFSPSKQTLELISLSPQDTTGVSDISRIASSGFSEKPSKKKWSDLALICLVLLLATTAGGLYFSTATPDDLDDTIVHIISAGNEAEFTAYESLAFDSIELSKYFTTKAMGPIKRFVISRRLNESCLAVGSYQSISPGINHTITQSKIGVTTVENWKLIWCNSEGFIDKIYTDDDEQKYILVQENDTWKIDLNQYGGKLSNPVSKKMRCSCLSD
jgi:hypothetical protein